jgi:histidinol dehydrogenase
MSSLRILRPGQADYVERVEALRARLHGGALVSADSTDLDVPKRVGEILESVRVGGDPAAARLTSQLDRAAITPQTLRVAPRDLEHAHAGCDVEFLKLMRGAISNIRSYQQQILIQAPPPLRRGGRELGVRYTPLDRVAVYVPGGRALYPSTVLMTVVPAQVAGVREIVMVSPPTGGEINSMALALARELNISEVYRLGGAVGIAAMAFGTQTIKPVNKIVGPGNAFVAEAKRQLFGRVGIDSIAGPSEVLIVADDSANPAWVAADLLAQAEHNPGSALLVTPSFEFASRVAEQVDQQLTELERADVTRPSLEEYSAAIVVEDLGAACELANRFATEHLQIMTRDDEACLSRIRHAGAIFVGAHTPVPLGDYYAGPSHVLPTGGTARFFGPLSCNDFIKATSVVRYEKASLVEDASNVSDFARREGLTAHARAVTIRTERPEA